MRGKWMIFAALGLWALLSVLVLSGEADENVSFADELLVRLSALVSFVVCLLVGRYCDRHGLLPDITEED